MPSSARSKAASSLATRRRNSFPNVRSLIAQIRTYVKNHNDQASPFRWVASADDILE
jgi:hypothetical protein